MPDQECDKYDQIVVPNKNAGEFITLSVFLMLYPFKLFLTSISSIYELIDVIIYSNSIELSTSCIVDEIDKLLLSNFPVTFFVYQYYYYITANNNYLKLGEISIISLS